MVSVTDATAAGRRPPPVTKWSSSVSGRLRPPGERAERSASVCRWVGYCGKPIRLEELLYEPPHSLIEQSRASGEEHLANADGFGVGWYGHREQPGLFRSVAPAWGDRNFRDLCAQVTSHLFLAHVRAATGTAVQETNCHPFR